MTEVWKPITDYPNYQVSSYGRIKNIKTNKILKPIESKEFNKQGELQYIRYRVSLFNDNGKKPFTIARLVAQEFIPNPNNFETVDHIDFDTSNNNVTNLRWMTSEDNSAGHRIKIHNNRRVRCIETGKEFDSIADAARHIGVCRQFLCKVLNPKIKDKHTAKGFHWEYID